MRAVFFGTPAIAVPALRALADIGELVGVVCQPDRPAGRGLTLTEPAVKQAARELGVSAHQPVKVKTGALHEWLASLNADVAVVLAYGRILPAAVLSAPRLGCLNLHASVLPKYRGAAPINWAIVHGEDHTGISLMHMDEGLDTGPVYTRHSLAIGELETAGELAQRLAELAAEVVRRDVPRVVCGELRATPQNDSEATFAPPLTREHSRIDWSQSARSIVNLVRGMAPRPGAHTTLRGKALRVLAARPAPELTLPAEQASLLPGSLKILGRSKVCVSTGEGLVELLRAQLEGKKELAASDLVNGRALAEGDVLGEAPR
ncbi:MAG TPA: methionyl-tRNA formyltransferase [Polyangiaceae bacterium]|nr:methionyl-tRNA formyltransferase [Polyangiaceae bacterium]